MKILQIPTWYPPEGGEFCRDQAIFLKKSDIDIDVLANVRVSWRKYKWKLFALPRKEFYSVEDGVTVLRNFYLKIPKSEKLNMQRWAKKTLQLFDLYVKEKGKPDIIHAHTCIWGGYVAYLIKEKYGIPYVITEHHGMFGHESEYTRKSFKDWYLEYFKKIFSSADYLLPVSYLLINKIKEFSQGNENICVISNILDNQLFSYRKKKIKRDTFVFFTANSYTVAKAFDVMLEAFEIVCKRKQNVELRIAGSGFDNPVIEQLLAKNENSHNKIVFCGLLSPSDVRNELWNADAYVLSSRAESQSISVLEAMCTGTPVVCTNVVPVEVATPITGYKTQVDNPLALAEAMIAMMDNYDKFDSLAISNHAHSVTDPKFFVDKTRSVYQEVIKKYDRNKAEK
jgi:glycosyltransferase involved in cell wall biosynthesis